MWKNFKWRLFLSFLGIISSNVYCYGQANWAFDIHGGMAITRIWTGTYYAKDGYYFQAAPAAGFGIGYHETKTFSFRGELNYDEIRSKREGFFLLKPGVIACLPPQTGYYAYVSNTVSLQYLSVNVLGRFYIGNKVDLYVEAGPGIALLFSSRFITSGKSFIYKNDQAMERVMLDSNHALPEQTMYNQQSMRQQLSPVNVCASTGLGLQLPFASKRYGMVARYTFGMLNIAKKSVPRELYKTDQLLLSLTYRL